MNLLVGQNSYLERGLQWTARLYGLNYKKRVSEIKVLESSHERALAVYA